MDELLNDGLMDDAKRGVGSRVPATFYPAPSRLVDSTPTPRDHPSRPTMPMTAVSATPA